MIFVTDFGLQFWFIETIKLVFKPVCLKQFRFLSRYKRNASNNAGGNPTRSFSLQHKTFSTLNYAQDFGPTGKESLKRLKRIRPRIRNG